MQIKIGWLYPRSMNIYGDRGNVVVLEQRSRWRGIVTETVAIGPGEPIPPDIDLFFFGGGQDQEQVAVSHDLNGTKGAALKDAIADGAAMLAVCGGYQLLGHEYRPHVGEPLAGIGVFDLVSVAGPERFIGNVIVEAEMGTLVGFENHSGLTQLGPEVQPLGQVRIGRGNNGRDGTEGARYRNAVGCYLHGALLPKNPHLADWLIGQALVRRHGAVDLEPLDDRLEMAAHASAVTRATKAR